MENCGGSSPPKWGSGGPRAPKLGYPVLKIFPYHRYELVVLSDRVTEIDAHWTGQRTAPCREGPCYFCREIELNPLRWQGWLAVCALNDPKIWLLSLTPGAGLKCPGLFLQSSDTLRGASLQVRRLTDSLRGKMMVEFKRHAFPCDKLPKAPDVPACLTAMWQAPLKLSTRLRMGQSPETDTIEVANE